MASSWCRIAGGQTDYWRPGHPSGAINAADPTAAPAPAPAPVEEATGSNGPVPQPLYNGYGVHPDPGPAHSTTPFHDPPPALGARYSPTPQQQQPRQPLYDVFAPVRPCAASIAASVAGSADAFRAKYPHTNWVELLFRRKRSSDFDHTLGEYEAVFGAENGKTRFWSFVRDCAARVMEDDADEGEEGNATETYLRSLHWTQLNEVWRVAEMYAAAGGGQREGELFQVLGWERLWEERAVRASGFWEKREVERLILEWLEAVRELERRNAVRELERREQRRAVVRELEKRELERREVVRELERRELERREVIRELQRRELERWEWERRERTKIEQEWMDQEWRRLELEIPAWIEVDKSMSACKKQESSPPLEDGEEQLRSIDGRDGLVDRSVDAGEEDGWTPGADEESGFPADEDEQDTFPVDEEGTDVAAEAEISDDQDTPAEEICLDIVPDDAGYDADSDTDRLPADAEESHSPHGTRVRCRAWLACVPKDAEQPDDDGDSGLSV